MDRAEPIPGKAERRRKATPRIAARFVFAFGLAFSASAFLDAPPPASPEQEPSRDVPPGMRCSTANLCPEEGALVGPAPADRTRSNLPQNEGEGAPAVELHP